MGCPGKIGPLSRKVSTSPGVLVILVDECEIDPAGVFAVLLDVVPPGNAGVNQFKLKAVSNRNEQVTVIKRMVPKSQSINSIRPGCSSHQRTRSTGLSVNLRRFLLREV